MTAAPTDRIAVITSAYLSVPERWSYWEAAFESFRRCCLFPGRIDYYVMDDRSPCFEAEIRAYCRDHGICHLGRVDPAQRRGFSGVLGQLVDAADAEFVIYLEPDHYFYLPYDFVTPIVRLYGVIPDLHEVYLRAPLVYEQFRLEGAQLVTYDQSRLHRVRIDSENTGWIGYGRNHESFSLMPGIFRSSVLQRWLAMDPPAETPWDLELRLAHAWEHRQLVGYLNAQAFCYHIGGAGKLGPGGFLERHDRRYEEVWSKKIL